MTTPYMIGSYGYQWLDDMVSESLPNCKVCDTPLVTHKYGSPLTVCPTCFPNEV